MSSIYQPVRLDEDLQQRSASRAQHGLYAAVPAGAAERRGRLSSWVQPEAIRLWPFHAFNCCTSGCRLAWRRCLTIASICLATSAPCFAAPEEIQVYLDEFATTGKFSLDLHTNNVLTAQPGSVTRRMLRVTPELSYGFDENWEGALYWLTSVGPAQSGGRPVTDGVKVRAKWRPRSPAPDQPWYGAINLEIGQLSRRFFPDQTSAEIKFIGVYQKNLWTAGVNLNIDRALRANSQVPTTVEVDTKLAYRVTPEDHGDLRVGLEHYAFLGPLRSQAGPSARMTSAFLVADLSLHHWDLNVGLGRASGATADKWILKAIIGVPLD